MSQLAEILPDQQAGPSNEVIVARAELANAVTHHEAYFISVDGPCALLNAPEIVLPEAELKAQNAAGLAGYIALDRECFFKPRSNPESWHGIDSTEPEAAQDLLSTLAVRHSNVVAEIGSLDQLERYGDNLTMIWIGGRNVDNTELIEDLAEAAPDVVIGVKNGLDGEVETALEQVRRIEQLRAGEGAPAVLIYRGGENAKTPRESQNAYKRAFVAAEGKLFYDTAHGVEMAYDLNGQFGKSTAGQVLASQALIRLSKQGFAPLGKFSEASALEAKVDPHMDLRLALNHSTQIYTAKLG